MNRILVEASEVSGGRVVLSDARAEHVRSVLRARPGKRLRAGVIDGSLAEATVEETFPDRVVLAWRELEAPVRPRVDLILALPRPKVLRRLLPQLAAIGVDRLILCGARRVEKFYFASHVLEPDRMRALLVEGCVQCGSPALPRVRVERRFASVVDRVQAEFAERDRVVLHPYTEQRLVEFRGEHSGAVLAVGPEGGWIPEEMEALRAAGFTPAGLGTRILRSDTACVLATGIMAQWMSGGSHGGA